jgi:hypothetical protein
MQVKKATFMLVPKKCLFPANGIPSREARKSKRRANSKRCKTDRLLRRRIYNYSNCPSLTSQTNLLVEGLGEGGSGSDVSIAGSLVGAGGLLEGLSISKVSGAVLLVGSSVVLLEVDIEELGEHLMYVRAHKKHWRGCFFLMVILRVDIRDQYGRRGRAWQAAAPSERCSHA